MKPVAALIAGLLWLSSPLADDHAVVLIYHHVSADTPASTSVTPATFERHLDFLERNEFNPWPLSRILDAVAARAPLPRNTVAITFDDAYRSVLEEALPRLQRRGWPFTLFVNTEAVDRGYATSLNWEQIRELARAGVEIANHSHSHDHLVRRRDGESEAQWRQRVVRDIETAAERIEAETGSRSRLFAYPFGEYSDALKAVVRDLGYRGIAQQSGAVGYLTDMLAVPRFPLAQGYDDLQRFATSVNSRPLPVSNVTATPSSRRAGDIEQLRIRLEPGAYRPQQLACYGGGETLKPSTVSDNPTEILVDLAGVGRTGRNKVNCTAPASGASGAYFWYSYQWLLRHPDGRWYDG